MVGVAKTARFLDEIKELGFTMAFKGGLSFNLNDVIIPPEKEELVGKAVEEVTEVMSSYNMGLITDNERYNQIIDIWTHTNSKLTNILMNQLIKDKQGFNSIYMMFDSGARGSKEANSPALWNARSDGQATEIWCYRWAGHYRKPDPIEL